MRGWSDPRSANFRDRPSGGLGGYSIALEQTFQIGSCEDVTAITFWRFVEKRLLERAIA